MEREANYVAVGTFMLVVIAMAVVFLLWYSNARERREYQPYEVYFSGSVSGLNEGSTVRYLGVNVGRVSHIRLDSRDPKRVQVIIELDASTPVKPSTLARLSMQGVTGLLFIDLSQATVDSRGINPSVPSDRYPVIRSVASDLDLFLSGLPELVTQATYVTNRLNKVLSDENLAALGDSLASVKAASKSLPALSQDALKMTGDLRLLIQAAQQSAQKLDSTLGKAGPEVVATAEGLRAVADHLASTATRIDGLVTRHEPELDRFTGQGLNELETLVRESRAAASEVRSLARSLRENPSRVLYNDQAPGVSIPP